VGKVHVADAGPLPKLIGQKEASQQELTSESTEISDKYSNILVL
jgi:hypothetical protein